MTHLIDGEFQSDKYPTTPRGKVPLSVKDKTAQDLLWEYAQRRRVVDAEFSHDLEKALMLAGFVPPVKKIAVKSGDVGDLIREKCFRDIQMVLAGHPTGSVLAAQVDSLGITIAFAADDREEAQRILALIPADLAQAIDLNWQDIKDRAGSMHGKPGHG